MKIWTLIENTPGRHGLEHEHGLSLYMEAAGHKLLFDFGQTGAFVRNAAALGIDLGEAELAVLSHGHFDHGGGMDFFLERNKQAKIYVNRYAFESHHRADGSNIGLDRALASNQRIVAVEGQAELLPGLRLVQMPMGPTAYQGLTRKEGDRFLPEDFRHEQYLLIEEGEKRILISGCSHRGAARILEYFQPDILVGGFHCRHSDPEGPELRTLAEELEKSHAILCTCHCTGLAQYSTLKQRLGERLRYLHTGDVLEL